MKCKFPDEFSRMRGMNLNLCILRMFEDIFFAKRGPDTLGIVFTSYKGDVYFMFVFPYINLFLKEDTSKIKYFLAL